MSAEANRSRVHVPFLEDGGEMGRRLRQHDWSATPIGPTDRWPQSLKTAVGIALRSPVPMVLLWGSEGVMIYNDPYAVFAGERHPELFGLNVLDGWGEITDFNAHVLDTCLAGGALAYRDKELVLHRDGHPERVWLNLDYSPILDESGKPAGVLAIVRETTARVLAERRAAAEHERLQRLFEQAPTFMAMMRGEDHVFELANPCYLQLVGNRDIIGKPVREALPEVVGQGFTDLLDNAFRTGEPATGSAMKVALQRKAGVEAETRYVDFVFQPIRNDNGSVTHIFVQGSDVTDRVRAQSHQRLLINELNHRVKNTLATALAIATRTLRQADSLQEGEEKLRVRLVALSRAQDVLTRESWSGADIGKVVEAALQPHADESGSRFDVSGPPLRLTSGAALSLSLAIHELCTNAIRHGALSADGGRVRLEWAVDRDETPPSFRLQWVETGGPIVAPPTSTGFGTTLLERGLAMEVGGRARIDYSASGAIFTLEAELGPIEGANV